jgi:hypothetical protein
VQPRLAGHGPTVFAGLAQHVDFWMCHRRNYCGGWRAEMRTVRPRRLYP